MRGNTLLRIGLLAGTILASAPAHAQTTRTGVILGAEAGAAVNPYLSREDTLVGVAQVEIRPWLQMETERETFELQSYFVGRAFSSTYDFEDSEGAELSVRSRRSANLTLYGTASVDSRSAQPVFAPSEFVPRLTDPVDPTDPDLGITQPNLVLPENEIDLLGQLGRSTTLEGVAGFEQRLGARSFVGGAFTYRNLSVDSDQRTGYDSYAVNANFSRQLNERTRAGVLAGWQKANYDIGSQSRTIFIEAVLQNRLSAAWTVDASAGVFQLSSERTDGLEGDNRTGFSGSVEVCNQRTNRDLCFNASRAPTPSAFGRVQTSTSVGLRYSERLSARDRLDLSGQYARNSSVLEDNDDTARLAVASVQASYNRSINDRFEAYGYGSIARRYGNILTDGVSAEFGVGVTYRLGQIR